MTLDLAQFSLVYNMLSLAVAAMGVAFDAQLLPEPVPHGPDDERLDWLLTDKRACAFV